MFFVTIRAKLVYWFTLVLALILVSFSALLYFTLSRALYDSVDKKLTTIAEITADSSTRIVRGFRGVERLPGKILWFPADGKVYSDPR